MRRLCVLTLVLLTAQGAAADDGVAAAEKAMRRAKLEARLMQLKAGRLQLQARRIELEAKQRLIEAETRLVTARLKATYPGTSTQRKPPRTDVEALRGKVLYRMMAVLIAQHKAKAAPQLKTPEQRAAFAAKLKSMREALARELKQHGAALFPDRTLALFSRALNAGADDQAARSAKLHGAIRGHHATFEAMKVELPMPTLAFFALYERVGAKTSLLDLLILNRLNEWTLERARAGHMKPGGKRASLRGKLLRRVMTVVLGQMKAELGTMKDPKQRATHETQLAQIRETLGQKLKEHGTALFPDAVVERIGRALETAPKGAAARLHHAIGDQLRTLETLGVDLPRINVAWIDHLEQQGAKATVLDLSIGHRLNAWALEQARSRQKQGKKQSARDAQIQKAVAMIKRIEAALERYEMHTDGYPTTTPWWNALITRPAGARNWRGPYLRAVPSDPWGQPFHFKTPGAHNRPTYDLWSAGPDRRSGSPDDVTNWSND